MATLKFNASGHSKLAQKTTVISSAPPSRPDVSSTDAHLGLLIEHLTFNPRAFIDALVYVANETLYKLGEDFESKAAKLIEERGDVDPEQAAQEAEKGTHSIMTLLENALDHVFDTLELYSLQSVFGVTERQARHMVLPHHAGLDLRNPRDRGAGSSNGTPKESTELSERQRDLTRRINAARSASYALTLAMQASERRLRRARAVHSCLSALLGATESGDDAKDAVQDTSKRLLKAVEVIKVHRALLIDSIEKLKAEGPLGKALTHPTSTLELEKGKLNNAAEGADAVQPWSSGREGYLRWQTQRMLSSIRRANGPWDNSADPADSSPRLAKGSQASSRKRKSILEERDEKRLSSQPSLAMHSSEGGMEGEEVGAANEMEALADLLQHRPGHPASCGSTPVSPLKKQT